MLLDQGFMDQCIPTPKLWPFLMATVNKLSPTLAYTGSWILSLSVSVLFIPFSLTGVAELFLAYKL